MRRPALIILIRRPALDRPCTDILENTIHQDSCTSRATETGSIARGLCTWGVGEHGATPSEARSFARLSKATT